MLDINPLDVVLCRFIVSTWLTQAITCLAMHPDKAHVATGQEGSSPFVLVWNSASKPPKTVARLQLGADKGGVSQVMISANPQHALYVRPM